MVRVKYDALVRAIQGLLAAEGVPSPIREVEAEVIAEADLMGVPSHGVRMLPGLVSALREGRVRKDPQLKLLHERPATCVLDGDNGPGRYVSVCAMQHAVERARLAGAGVCLATHTTHWGRAHAYAWRAAQAGMVGICATNAMSSMMVPGALRAVLGNNPLAIAVPREGGRDAVVLDLAMSQAAVGKIGTYAREGKDLPVGWGLDSAGRPTRDPKEALSARKFLPMGEHKGAGMAVMLELLTAALAGGLLGHEILEIDNSTIDPGSSKIFIALDIGSFGEQERFQQRVEDLLGYLHRSAEPGMEILYPGERGWQARARHLADGIPIHPDIITQLQTIGLSF